MSRVVIVARTRMRGDDICIGGHDLDHGFRSVRLLDRYGGHPTSTCPLHVGEVWEIDYKPKGSARPPHVEDVYVDGQQKLGSIPDLTALVLKHCRPWKGPPDVLFDSTARTADTGALIVPGKGRIPSRSTGYWVPTYELTLKAMDGRPRFVSSVPGPECRLAWVGVQPYPDVIRADSLLRVSLSRFFEKPPAPVGYYVQISGLL